MAARRQNCANNSIGLNPVAVTRTPAQETAGITAASLITPRALNGTPSSNGKVVFLGVGMSNTSNVWNGFRAAMNNAGTAPSTLKWLDATMGGMGAPQWADPSCECWDNLDAKILKANSHAQVGAVFLMLVTPYPWQSPSVNAARYQADVEAVVGQLEDRLPNLKLVYLAGNYYGGYDYGQDKTPEPHGYYENLTLQAIQDSHTGSSWVSASSSMLWTNGDTPRWDGLLLQCPADVTDGGVHLSAIGKAKLGGWLYDSLMADPTTAGWFR
jgi:hypothetical protein